MAEAVKYAKRDLVRNPATGRIGVYFVDTETGEIIDGDPEDLGYVILDGSDEEETETEETEAPVEETATESIQNRLTDNFPNSRSTEMAGFSGTSFINDMMQDMAPATAQPAGPTNPAVTNPTQETVAAPAVEAPSVSAPTTQAPSVDTSAPTMSGPNTATMTNDAGKTFSPADAAAVRGNATLSEAAKAAEATFQGRVQAAHEKGFAKGPEVTSPGAHSVKTTTVMGPATIQGRVDAAHEKGVNDAIQSRVDAAHDKGFGTAPASVPTPTPAPRSTNVTQVAPEKTTTDESFAKSVTDAATKAGVAPTFSPIGKGPNTSNTTTDAGKTISPAEATTMRGNATLSEAAKAAEAMAQSRVAAAHTKAAITNPATIDLSLADAISKFTAPDEDAAKSAITNAVKATAVSPTTPVRSLTPAQVTAVTQAITSGPSTTVTSGPSGGPSVGPSTGPSATAGSGFGFSSTSTATGKSPNADMSVAAQYGSYGAGGGGVGGSTSSGGTGGGTNSDSSAGASMGSNASGGFAASTSPNSGMSTAGQYGSYGAGGGGVNGAKSSTSTSSGNNSVSGTESFGGNGFGGWW